MDTHYNTISTSIKLLPSQIKCPFFIILIVSNYLSFYNINTIFIIIFY